MAQEDPLLVPRPERNRRWRISNTREKNKRWAMMITFGYWFGWTLLVIIATLTVNSALGY